MEADNGVILISPFGRMREKESIPFSHIAHPARDLCSPRNFCRAGIMIEVDCNIIVKRTNLCRGVQQCFQVDPLFLLFRKLPPIEFPVVIDMNSVEVRMTL